MFSVMIAGRLPQTNFQQVSETQFVIPVSDVDHVNHLVVFMTGQLPFPDHLGGGVYFSWPSTEGPTWIYLGKITNTKPSAIFKINKVKETEENRSRSLQVFGSGYSSVATDGLLGISAEPLTQLEQQTQPADIQPSIVSSQLEYTTKMLQNFFNYIISFAQTIPNTNEQIVPLNQVQTWYTNFQRKLQENPNFWKSSA